ncbi:MAG: redox-sensing transcriptional repressor Rex [Clostridiales bacterium]|nr:redox-sensing transcriptional repressor Rex [Clostridiales bacterium]
MSRIPEAVMRRLPRYYRHLDSLEKKDIIRVSSKQLGESLRMTASQIRHDLNFFGGFGQQGYGYNVTELKQKLVHILGIDIIRNVIIVGAGNIGNALARYGSFENEGFKLLAIFDNDEKLIGTKIRNILIHDSEELVQYIKDNKIDIVVLTIPGKFAQQIAYISQQAGAGAIWNFAPVDVTLEGIEVENIHLTDSLMTLSFRLACEEKGGC